MKVFGILLFLSISLAANSQTPVLKEGLETFVKQNTIYPPYSLHNCIQGTIKVAFKVNSKGEVHDSYVSNGLGVDLDEEALRLIQMSSGKWTVPSSYDTTAVLVVPVHFMLSGYGCERYTNTDLALAIQSYKNYEDLISVITNYYVNKENGTAKAEDEYRIISLKQELKIDDDYLDGRIEMGLKKIKQGDKKGACKEFTFVKHMGSDKADAYISKYCN